MWLLLSRLHLKRVGFRFLARRYFTPSQLMIPHTIPVRPTLDWPRLVCAELAFFCLVFLYWVFLSCEGIEWTARMGTEQNRTRQGWDTNQLVCAFIPKVLPLSSLAFRELKSAWLSIPTCRLLLRYHLFISSRKFHEWEWTSNRAQASGLFIWRFMFHMGIASDSYSMDLPSTDLDPVPYFG